MEMNKYMSRYANTIDKYDLCEGINEDILRCNGFNRNGIFKCYVYKNMLQLIIQIDIENQQWDYQIFNIDTQMIYPSYYNRNGSIHLEIDEIDKKVNKIFCELENKKIFKKVKD